MATNTSTSELACVYSALILHDADISITADKISTLIHAAGVSVEPIWPTLFAKALEGKDIGALVSSVGMPAATLASPTERGKESGVAVAEQQKVEGDLTKKEDSDSGEESEDMGFGLFDD